MRRIWILVPFWSFFLGYLVYFARTRESRRVVAATSVGASHSVPDHLEVPPPHLPDGPNPAATTAVSPRRVLESRPSSLTEAELAGLIDGTAAKVFVLPRTVPASPVSFLWPVDAEGSPDQPELLALASRASFPRWTLYEDEWVSFYYPADEAITLEVLDGSASFPMIGETMWTVADAPERRYRLATTGGATFCMISLEKTGVLDDTPRFPKPEVFHRLWMGDGSLCRASLMSDGNLRRIEVLAGGDRASVLDWPHCAIHRDVYDRLALTLRLNGPVAEGEMLLAARRSELEIEGRLGLLSPGMDSVAVTAILGPPAEREGDFLVYREIPTISAESGTLSVGDEIVYRVPVAGGRFEGFGKGWRSHRRTPPEPGSLVWMLEKTGGTGGEEGTVGYDLGPLTDEESAAMFDRFCAEAPQADAEGWDTLCRVLANLAEMGARDDRVLPYIGARFLDLELPQGNATQLLHAYDPEGGRDLFAARLRALLTRAEDAAEVPGMAHDLQVLIAYMGSEDTRTEGLLNLAMRHPNRFVRESGYGFLEWLPQEQAAGFLEQGLTDANVSVRRRCAEALCGDSNPTARLLELVSRRLSAENDVQTLTYLEEARRLHEEEEPGAAQVPAAVHASGETPS
jgi:hypothetical protein